LISPASILLNNKESSSAKSSSAGEEFTVSKGDAINDYSESCLSTLVSGAPSPLLGDKPLINALPVEKKNVI
jgi:hypothetical protein